ncbi:MAG: UvrD-helicase domain-containing protein [Prolixibacteraceae bacterium]|nr:UvrD-helicase domain-containing protein [Prolixibacteraceae bacterium]
MDFLKGLNKAQNAAVTGPDSPALVIAGAGSGKTRVLTFRIAYLLKKGIPADKIMALTFTNKAAKEMKERISSLVGSSVTRQLWVGTFHSIFSRILRMESEAVGMPSNFTIYDSSDSKNLIHTILKSLSLDEKIYKKNIVAKRISMAKNNLITPAAYKETSEIIEYDESIRMPRIFEVYKEYARRCQLAGAMDFDDLLLKTNLLFRNHPEILKKYQQRFTNFLVDEYQDTNYAQYLIVKYLASVNNHLFVVGDDAQSIYSFRGARIENILNFKRDYPQYHLYKLEQNYRSTQTIVDAANSIISKNKKQIPKRVFSENSKGDNIKVFEALTDNEEGIIVAKEIMDKHLSRHDLYKDDAILYRTNAQSRILEESLRKLNIPYKIYGGLSFYQRKEIRDILSYFRLVVNENDNEALKRIINFPVRGIGATTLGKLEQSSLAEGKSIFELIKNILSCKTISLNKGTLTKLIKFSEVIQKFSEINLTSDAYTTANTIITQTGLMSSLYKDQTPEGLSRYENMEELINGIKEFTTNAKEEGQPEKLSDYMEGVALMTDQDMDKEGDDDKVALMTIHSAKGLEFKNIFIVGMEENLFPSCPIGGTVTLDSLEEERRLFYVAVTRAEENACLSYAKQRYRWGKLEFCNPSRFIREIDNKFLDLPEEDDSMEMEYQEESSSFGSQSNNFSSKAISDQKSFYKKTKNISSTPLEHPAFLKKKLIRLNQANQQINNFQEDDPRKIQVGMQVEHNRFGRGKVLKTEGVFPDLRAVIFFKNIGEKQLILKFAKLKILENH